MTLSRERTRLLARLRSRRTREREGSFLVEGIRSVGEALDGGARVRFAVVSGRLDELAGGASLRDRLRRAGVDTVEVEREELAFLSETEASQGVLLVCEEPGEEGTLPPGPLLVLDGVQDPGNVGTLLRASAAFGMGGVVVLDGTADPYNPKAVRAAAGSLFRIPVVRATWEQMERLLTERGPLLLADMGGRDVAGTRPRGEWALVVGSEASGPRPELRAAATDVVSIPMRGEVESLNAAVAGAVLLYVLTREGGEAR